MSTSSFLLELGKKWGETAYGHAPVWAQNAAISLAGKRVYEQRYAEPFHELLSQAMAATYASPSDISYQRNQQWERLIAPAVAFLPGYQHRRFPLDELPSLSVLTKAQVRDNIADYLHPERALFGLVQAHTSGTTGAGLQFVTTEWAVKRQWAYWWRYRKWHGIPFGEWSGVFGGRTIVSPHEQHQPFWRVNHGGRTVMYSQYHLTPEHALAMLKDIQKRKLRWLHGYPSLLALLARVGIDAGMSGLSDVKWITIGAENLLASQVEVIKRMFGVAPKQHYGLAEAVANISECPAGRLHVDEDFSVVEFVPRSDGGEGYRIVGTTLDNRAMPLLRYDTGDIALLPDDPNERCSCGRMGRLVKAIDGRKEDYLVLSDGSLVGRIDHLFKDATSVTEAQVVQRKRGEAIFRIVRAEGYATKDEDALRREVTDRFGDRLGISFEYVDALPRSSRGKLRLVVSEMDEAKVE